MDGGHIALKIYMGNELDSCNSCNHTATFNEEFLMNSFLRKNNLLNKKRTCQSRLRLAASCAQAVSQQLRLHRRQRHLLDRLLVGHLQVGHLQVGHLHLGHLQVGHLQVTGCAGDVLVSG